MASLHESARSLCGALFAGTVIEHVRAHRITANFSVESHQHEDLIQFDWFVNCRGKIRVGDEVTRAEGCTFQLVPPRVPHAMSLEPSGEEGRVFHVRIRPDATLRRTLRIESIVQTSLPASGAMESALLDVWRLTVGSSDRSLLRLAKLAEAIALWPGSGESAANGAKPSSGIGIDRDLDSALRMMEQSLLSPPDLEALARAAHLSVRHFTRRFRATFGIAPMEYLDRKRLALAQQMLAYEASSVGDVAEKMHFSSLATFSRWFSNLAGESPTTYRSRPHAL
jgi:AraC-like DNA-binding protein